MSRRQPGEVVHQCPGTGEVVTPCCGLTPFELPRKDRLATDRRLVTCKPDTPRARPGVATLARDLARELCTGGTGGHATRLVLVVEESDPSTASGRRRLHELGGWSERAVAHVIERALLRARFRA